MSTLTATVLPELGAVRLEVAGAPAGPAVIIRTDHNGTADVRQLEGQQTSAGTLVVTDFEPALFGPITYALEGATPAVVSLEVARPFVSVAVSPFYRAEVVSFTTGTETVDDRGAEHVILDSPAAVILRGPMSLRSGELEAWCASYEDAHALRAALSTGEVVHIRHPEHRGMDAYVAVRSVTVSPYPQLVHDLDAGGATLRWRVGIRYAEQPTPTGALRSAAGWNYNELTALGLTYDQLPALFPTYNDLAVGP